MLFKQKKPHNPKLPNLSHSCCPTERRSLFPVEKQPPRPGQRDEKVPHPRRGELPGRAEFGRLAAPRGHEAALPSPRRCDQTQPFGSGFFPYRFCRFFTQCFGWPGVWLLRSVALWVSASPPAPSMTTLLGSFPRRCRSTAMAWFCHPV